MNRDGTDQKKIAESWRIEGRDHPPAITMDSSVHYAAKRLDMYEEEYPVISKDGTYAVALSSPVAGAGHYGAKLNLYQVKNDVLSNSIYADDNIGSYICDRLTDFAPDNSAIVGIAKTGSGLRNIFLAKISNGKLQNPELLTNTEDRKNFDPMFSPDGKEIAFLSQGSGGLELWIMNNDGTNKRKIQRVTNSTEDIPGRHLIAWN